MSGYNIDTFLKNADNYIKYSEQGNFSHEYDELCERAREGEKPCGNCWRKEKCQTLKCLPFFIWFKNSWRNIQKAAAIFNE